ncbi:MAG TPA: 3-deoxy-7-phosphoheptulonate synthase [Acidimicrobiia bacterium]|nr:3-deoxy-7-phosphoheptulonate synthase [Acidimicrobiia bacterium]
MKPAATQSDIDYVVARISSLGFRAHVSTDLGQSLIGVVGPSDPSTSAALSGLRGVEAVLPVRNAYRLASREFREAPSIVRVGEVAVGEGEPVVVMAGPCSVENRATMMEAALAARDAGAVMLRGGAFKPRTSPYSFQGLAEDGLRLLAEAREETGLPVVTEVIAPETVPMVAEYADMLQIGTRNMQNFPLLMAVGRSGRPVLLKRGMMSTIEELLLSAEYILAQGNHQVVLCERGVRGFDTVTRNTLDISAIPVLKERTHLPVIIDPSHAAGKRSLVPALSRAAVAAGADGLLIEMHPQPEKALSDGDQSVTPQQLKALVDDCRRVATAIGRSL